MLKGITSRLIVGTISVFVGIVFQLPSISQAEEFLNSPRAKFTGTVGFPPPPPSQPQPSIEPVAGEDYVADELIVKFKEGVKEDQKSQIHKKLGSNKIYEFEFIKAVYVKLQKDMTVDEAIKDYMADPDVEYAEPNIIYKFSSPPYDNPYYSLQWSLPDINASAAWNMTTGRSDIVIGLIDTGIDYYHEDFTYFDSILNTNIYNIWINPNPTCGDIIGIDTTVTPDCSNPNFMQYPMDTAVGPVGHGTHVAGIIGATAYNAKGIVGVNWDVKLLICRAPNLTTNQILTCMDYFKIQKANGNNIVAINASWGGETLSRFVYDAIQVSNDILFVAAAGNAGTSCANKDNPDNDKQPQYPASYSNYFVDASTGTEKYLLPNVISVAATDSNSQIANDTWSFCNNVSWQSCYGRRSVDIGAPGVDILSTFPFSNVYYPDPLNSDDCLDPDGGEESVYCYLSGTSMATPHVTGLAGLIASKYLNAGQNYNSMQIRNLILTGGDDIAGLKDITITGKRINAYNSLNCSNKKVFSVLRISPDNSPTAIAPLVPNTPTNLSVMSLNCANSAGPVTVSPAGGTAFNLSEGYVIINNQLVGTGVYDSYNWTPGDPLPDQITFSSPAGSETFYAPTLTSVFPATGSQYTETSQKFSTVIADQNGTDDITGIYFILRPDLNSTANGIIAYYSKGDNKLSLLNDAGTAWISTITCGPGKGVADGSNYTDSISNSQGTLSCKNTTVSVFGNDLTINWSITPKSSFIGTKNIYLYAYDQLGLNTAWQQKGPWVIRNLTYTVTPSSGPGGTISPGTPQTINSGSTAAFTITANTGYHIASVSGCSGSLIGNMYTTGPITGDCAITASFTLNQYTVTASAGANGSLDTAYRSSPQTVNYNETTSFKFKASTGYHVAGVSGCWGTAYNNTSNSVAGYTYTSGPIAGDCTVAATFAINQYNITASAGVNGSLDTAYRSSPQTVNYNGTTSFKFNASTGYHVAGVSGCAGAAYNNTSNTVTTYTYTTGPITGDCTVTATFVINLPTAGFAIISTKPGSGKVPLQVSFQDTSTPAASQWNWDFGDGHTSTEQNPTHVYKTYGTGHYYATLTAANAGGSSVSGPQNITVLACDNLQRVKLSGSVNPYDSISDAYAAAGDGDTIQSQAIDFTEDLILDKNIVFDGGYDCNIQEKIGNTVIKGAILIRAGSAIFNGITIE